MPTVHFYNPAKYRGKFRCLIADPRTLGLTDHQQTSFRESGAIPLLPAAVADDSEREKSENENQQLMQEGASESNSDLRLDSAAPKPGRGKGPIGSFVPPAAKPHADASDIESPASSADEADSNVDESQESGSLASVSSTTESFESSTKPSAPLRGIKEPGPNDYLIVRGGTSHPANVRYLKIVSACNYEYNASTEGKATFTAKAVNAWRSQNPPGRFLKQNEETRLWNDVGNERAIHLAGIRIKRKKSPRASPSDSPDQSSVVVAANIELQSAHFTGTAQCNAASLAATAQPSSDKGSGVASRTAPALTPTGSTAAGKASNLPPSPKKGQRVVVTYEEGDYEGTIARVRFDFLSKVHKILVVFDNDDPTEEFDFPDPEDGIRMLGEESAATVTAKWPLRGIVEPGEHDVRCERPRGKEHPGNVAFRQMVDAHSAAYASAAPGKERNALSLLLVKEWRDQVPPGRFLQQNADTGLWDDIGNEKATKKISTRLWKAMGFAGGTEAAASLPGLQSQPATTPSVELNMDLSGSSSNSGALGFDENTPRVLPLKKRDHSGSDTSDLSDGPLRELNSNDLLNLSGSVDRCASKDASAAEAQQLDALAEPFDENILTTEVNEWLEQEKAAAEQERSLEESAESRDMNRSRSSSESALSLGSATDNPSLSPAARQAAILANIEHRRQLLIYVRECRVQAQKARGSARPPRMAVERAELKRLQQLQTRATVRLAERLEREELEGTEQFDEATEGGSTGEETGQSTPEGATEDGSTGEETEQSTSEEERRAKLEAEERWKLLAAEEAAKLEAEREAAKLAAEEAKRLAMQETARMEAQQLAEQRATAEAKRLAAEEEVRLEAQRLAEQRAAEELAAEEAKQEEAARLEAERRAGEEAARQEAEKRARLEVERVKSAATSKFSPMVSKKPAQQEEAPPTADLEVASAIKAETKPATGKRKAPGSRVFDLEYAEGHKRPPRASRTVRKINYQEPSLGKKLRRGDKHFPSFAGFSPKDDASKK
ncbi:hypothetical protein ACHAXT_012986 [Thalassiosira profunda]